MDIKRFRDVTTSLSQAIASLGQVIILFTHMIQKMKEFWENSDDLPSSKLLYPEVATLIKRLIEELHDCHHGHPEYMLVTLCDPKGHIGYSVIEELEKGTTIGNLFQDLQMDMKSLFNCKFHITYDTKIHYVDVNSKNGNLYIKNVIDREQLCSSQIVCMLKLGIVFDMPLEVFQIEIHVWDINDNSPVFPENEIVLKIAESTPPGTYFPLEGASDPDVGSNSLCSYQINPNDYFGIETHSNHYGSKSVELVLKQALDREQQASHQLILRAADCGIPKRSATTHIEIQVQDANDNHPIFAKQIYRVSIPEDYPVGELIVVLNATDMDEGVNADIEYLFSNNAPHSIKQLFQIERNSGEVRLKGLLDYEVLASYEIHVQAKDNGQLVMTGNCKVVVDVTDVNDNSPKIKVTSLSGVVKEDSKPGFVLALFTVIDRDSGSNGQISCKIPESLPFHLRYKFSNYYSLVLKNNLDRELVSDYNVSISAIDAGFPSLSTTTYIHILVADVNDNPPIFTDASYISSIDENILPGTLIFQISASDQDFGENSRISYSLLDTYVKEMPISLFITINSDSGKIVSKNSFDFEQIQILHIIVKAKDHGSPSLSNCVNLTVFIQDQNDNWPHVSSPLSTGEIIWRSVKVGQVVSKLRAVDADSGYNAWLSFEMDPLTNTTLFRIGRITGEISVARNIEKKDEDIHRLLIMVKDHGQPPKSTFTSVIITVMETNQERKDDYILLVNGEKYTADLNMQLIVAIALISGIFVSITILQASVKYHRVVGSTGMLNRVDDFDCVRYDWTLLENQKFSLNVTPLHISPHLSNTTSTPHQSWKGNSGEGLNGELIQGVGRRGSESLPVHYLALRPGFGCQNLHEDHSSPTRIHLLPKNLNDLLIKAFSEKNLALHI
ncbi:protocadherin alpha-5-like [Rhinophrynus dorsalis]